MKKYQVEVIRWEPQWVGFQIEAENALEARMKAVQMTHDEQFEQAEIFTSRYPIRTTVLKCNRIREKK